jgi:single-stranded DNA-binding protein
MNKVILMGRLTSDPKMDWTRSEDSKQYATYTLAVNRHPISLQSRWDWQSRRDSIPLTKHWKMMICRFKEG